MRVVSFLLGPVLVAACVRAQYFSEGWKPGQQAYGTGEAAPAAPLYTPGAEPPINSNEQQGNKASFDFSKLWTSGPVASLLAKAGVNFSVNATEELWDPRVPLITDNNYQEVIVNETLTAEEEERRTWFLVISTSLGQQQQGGISRLVDKQFDEAFNTSLVENDLPDVRWGRIDYLNVTYITTKWNVWQGPWLVVLRDRGQSLRFYNARQVRLNSTIMRNFLKEEGWKNTEPWTSMFAPGGKREFVLHYFALGMKYSYDTIVRVPKFILMIITGALGSLILRLLHSQPSKPAESKPKQPVAKPAAVAEASSTPAPTPASPAKKSGAKGKKTGKK
ncbi:hypothetical protein NM688_g2336 [Phlebia brevispora]|uniref:Uncharacterized protein n=1 Tax=Phlebia brevispora TaxID=194682 RepID=A0ACC1T8R9_9APHY|nr:hypothetical protein NM688_g2336 [Phlebia brevispora]